MFDFKIADPIVSIYVLLLNTSDIVSRYTEVRLSQLGVTPTQYTVLVTLRACDKPPTLTELGQRLFRSKKGLTTVVENLEREGLVKKVKDPADARAIRVEATEKGNQLFENVRLPSRELVYEIMSCYDEKDVTSFKGLLERLRRHILQLLGDDGHRPPISNKSSLEANDEKKISA